MLFNDNESNAQKCFKNLISFHFQLSSKGAPMINAFVDTSYISTKIMIEHKVELKEHGKI